MQAEGEVGRLPDIWASFFSARVARWVIFGALFAITPVVVAGLANTATQNGSFWIYMVRGDVLLVSATLSGTALGELIGADVEPLVAVTAGGAVGINLFAAAILYPFVSFVFESKGESHLNHQIVLVASLLSFVVTLVAGSNCIAAVKEKK